MNFKVNLKNQKRKKNRILSVLKGIHALKIQSNLFLLGLNNVSENGHPVIVNLSNRRKSEKIIKNYEIDIFNDNLKTRVEILLSGLTRRLALGGISFVALIAMLGAGSGKAFAETAQPVSSEKAIESDTPVISGFNFPTEDIQTVTTGRTGREVELSGYHVNTWGSIPAGHADTTLPHNNVDPSHSNSSAEWLNIPSLSHVNISWANLPGTTEVTTNPHYNINAVNQPGSHQNIDWTDAPAGQIVPHSNTDGYSIPGLSHVNITNYESDYLY